MDKATKNIFFLGKGGVGKSTTSAITALYLSERGKNVQLVSMDPAHNQSDIFEKSFGEKAVKLNKHLAVKEVDLNKWVKKYLADIQFQVKRSYSYLTAFNLEHYLDLIKYSPGIEEYAMLMAYKDIRKKAKGIDYIIFDMPPTALTLKFMTLPQTSLLWLKKLMDLRNKIIEKRKIISKIKFGTKEIETDKIRNKLTEQIKDYNEIELISKNPDQTLLNLVMNPDKLSFSESMLIVEHLKKFNITIQNIFLNKYNSQFGISHIQKQFSNTNLQLLSESNNPLIGIPELTNYINNLATFIEL
jgi:arsenite-transporting ATPase